MGDAEWLLAPDQRHVLIRRAGNAIRVPVAVATDLWVAAGQDVRREAGRAPPFVLFSLIVPPASRTGRLHIVFSESGPVDGPPPWPAWLTSTPAPAWQDCPAGAWRALPDTAHPCSAELLRANAREQRAADGDVRRGIEDRCQRVQQHGDDDAFTESLEYYTTLRVKHACLRMNDTSLCDRRERVERVVAALQRVLRAAPAEFAAAFVPPPTPTPQSVEAVPFHDDPNALCVPQTEDYVL